ncbi:MAG: hypothetical protein RSA87_03885, partial [Malacoplasma sp.]
LHCLYVDLVQSQMRTRPSVLVRLNFDSSPFSYLYFIPISNFSINQLFDVYFIKMSLWVGDLLGTA